MNYGFARFLPAVNRTFAECVERPITEGRMFPNGIASSDLAFWRPNALWNYDTALYSLGAHDVGARIKNGIVSRPRSAGAIFFDSGGFQLANGTWKNGPPLRRNMTAEDAISTWRSYRADTLQWVTRTSERCSDYAMTLDIPPWTTLPPSAGAPFHRCTFDELLTLTQANLKFIDQNRQNRTKWLNVIHGLSEDSTEKWWDAVKWFPCDGYALGGHAGCRGGIAGLLHSVLMMRDDGAFSERKKTLHVLGCGTIKWAVILSAVQRSLRESTGVDVQITFDCSTPFQSAGVREKLLVAPDFSPDECDWKFTYEEAPQAAKYVGSIEPSGLRSPLGRVLRLGDINVNSNRWCQRKFDGLSNAIVAHHNVWVMVDTFERANQLAVSSDRSLLPPTWGHVLDGIGELLTCSNWRCKIAKAGEVFC